MTSSVVDRGINAFFAQLSSHGSLLKEVPLVLEMAIHLTRFARPSGDVQRGDKNPDGPIHRQIIPI